MLVVFPAVETLFPQRSHRATSFPSVLPKYVQSKLLFLRVGLVEKMEVVLVEGRGLVLKVLVEEGLVVDAPEAMTKQRPQNQLNHKEKYHKSQKNSRTLQHESTEYRLSFQLQLQLLSAVSVLTVNQLDAFI